MEKRLELHLGWIKKAINLTIPLLSANIAKIPLQKVSLPHKELALASSYFTNSS